jgi:drug/metabolite transporter (DMT)-like permease
MLALKIVVVLLLMGSIPMWIRMLEVSSWTIAIVRLSWGLGLTVLFFKKRINFKLLSLRDVRVAPRKHLMLVALGVCFGIHWITYFESIQRSSATLGILALSTYGIHVTWLAALFSERRPKTQEWVAVAFSALGAWICLPSAETHPGALFGFLLGLVSAVFYAALPLLHQKQQELNLPTRGSAQFLFAWILFLPIIPSQSWDLPRTEWLILCVLGVVCTFVAHNLWIAITTEVRPATSGLIYYLTIPITMILETLFLDRPPSMNQALGAFVIIAGILSKNVPLTKKI